MEKPIDQSTADRLTQPIVKQKKKPKKQKCKAVANDRTTDSETPLANRKCDEVLQKLTECLRISDCDVVTNGDCDEHTSKLSAAGFNQSNISVPATNLSKETIATAIGGGSTVTADACNKTSSARRSNRICTELEPKLINEIDEQPSTGDVTTISTTSSSSPSSSTTTTAISTGVANVKHTSLELDPEQQYIEYKVYENELQMPDIMRLIQKDLSEPYSIYTYRYFIHNWPKLCFLAMHGTNCVGAIVCKLDFHRQQRKRGYIAMLAVDEDYRKLKIGTNLVAKAIQAMLVYNADEVVLETEITNIPALRLYENLGFVRDKRLFGYYLNGVDALRLKLWFR